ncbi:MAG: hypothetical protein L0K01_04245 [Brachybacterium sp.]|nr:hypothetical protein [Brachybacterium sp.]
MRRSRRSVLSAAALGLALAASGCTYRTPVQTTDFYPAAAGTNATIMQDESFYAGVRNAVVVFDAEGANPVFYTSAVNYSDEETTVEIEGLVEGASVFTASVQVPAHGTVEIGPQEGQQSVPIDSVDVVPGAIIELEVVAADQSTTISLPTLTTSLDHFTSEEPAAG